MTRQEQAEAVAKRAVTFTNPIYLQPGSAAFSDNEYCDLNGKPFDMTGKLVHRLKKSFFKPLFIALMAAALPGSSAASRLKAAQNPLPMATVGAGVATLRRPSQAGPPPPAATPSSAGGLMGGASFPRPSLGNVNTASSSHVYSSLRPEVVPNPAYAPLAPAGDGCAWFLQPHCGDTRLILFCTMFHRLGYVPGCRRA